MLPNLRQWIYGANELFISWRAADKTLPGAALFLTQCSAEIGEHEQFMGQTALAKCTSPHAPTSPNLPETRA